MLAVVWAGALLGACLKVFTGLRYQRFGFALYLVLGWIGVLALPALLAEPERLVLTLVAGLLYTVGAILFSLHRPLPASRWFGYHEVWHAFGVVAGLLLFLVNAGLVASAT
jgi:hemolysin III